MKFNDPIVRQFASVYTIKNLLEDLSLEKIMSQGDYYMALCPFHDNTKEPDFQIHKKYGLWNCFGCGKTGNLYQFVAFTHHLTYGDANEYIAKLAGFDSDADIEDIRFKTNLRTMFEVDDEVGTKILNIPEINAEVLNRMNTGPDPDNYLLGRGYSQETLDHFGCTYTNVWRTWDKIREEYRNEKRAVIPGYLQDGTICGFIGRTTENVEPKYRYSKGYPKSITLFNAHRAKKVADNGLILVEGSLDTINVHNLGWPNVGGILGASPSDEQIDFILKTTDKVFLGFDNDKAGRIATEKAINALHNHVEIFVLDWGNLKDPDEIKNPSVFQSIIKNAHSLSRYMLQSSI